MRLLFPSSSLQRHSWLSPPDRDPVLRGNRCKVNLPDFHASQPLGRAGFAHRLQCRDSLSSILESGLASLTRGADTVQAQELTPVEITNPTWEEWVNYFNKMDTSAASVSALTAELQEAVAAEDYKAAGIIKQHVQTLKDADVLDCALQQLKSAAAEERYVEAAELRDATLSGLAGWWAGRRDADPSGHLLYIRPEYGRWTGRMYVASDIAECQGWTSNAALRSLLMPTMPQPSWTRVGSTSDQQQPGQGGGAPLMEVWLRKDEETDLLKSQPVFMLTPNSVPKSRKIEPDGGKDNKGPRGGEDPTRKSGGGGGLDQISEGSSEATEVIQEMIRAIASSADLAGTPLAVSINVGSDGATSILLTPVDEDEMGKSKDDESDVKKGASRDPSGGTIQSDFDPWDAAEARETLAALKLDDQPKSGKSSAASESINNEGTLKVSNGISELKERIRRALERTNNAPSTVKSESVSDIKDQLLQAVDQSTEQSQVVSTSSANDTGSIASAMAGAYRTAAAAAAAAQEALADMLGREAEDDKSTIKRSILLNTDSPSDSGDENQDDLSFIEGTSASSISGLRRLPAEIRMQGRDAFTIQLPASFYNGEDMESLESVPPLAPKPWRSQDQLSVQPPMLDTQMEAVRDRLESAAAFRQIDESEVVSSTSRIVDQAEDMDELRDAVEQAMSELNGGMSEGRLEKMIKARALQTAASAARLSKSSSSSSAAASTSSTYAPITYRRLPTSMPRTDPLSGLYLGAFGPHGPELLLLQRTMKEGEEVVVATKVTGDVNVPAGDVCFTAKIGPRERLTSRDVYPEELGVMARYRGEGRVRMSGAPTSVAGELLVMGGGSGHPITAGAELGFVWAVPNERKYLILLHRVDLSSCEA